MENDEGQNTIRLAAIRMENDKGDDATRMEDVILQTTVVHSLDFK